MFYHKFILSREVIHDKNNKIIINLSGKIKIEIWELVKRKSIRMGNHEILLVQIDIINSI